jgi:hypothetical protein
MRSKYIYLIYPRYAEHGGRLLSAHTVKHEAAAWLSRSKWTTQTAMLMRVEDGVIGDRDFERDGGVFSYKPATRITWESCYA